MIIEYLPPIKKGGRKRRGTKGGGEKEGRDGGR